MANITVTNQPSDFDLAYGPNILSLYDLDEDGLRYVVRIINTADDSQVAEVRQLPNVVGYGHFDIQRILQTQVFSNPDLESTTILKAGDEEMFSYRIEYGYLSAGSVTVSGTLPSETGEFVALNGRKLFYEVDWDDTPYKPTISSSDFGGVTIINPTIKQKALTDRHYNQITGAQITDGKPSVLGDNEVVYEIDVNRYDDYTLSFVNGWVETPATPAWYNGINFFIINRYNGSTSLGSVTINNLTGNGGGPDVNVGDDIAPSGDYKVISAQVGYRSTNISSQTNMTHYYVCAYSYAAEDDTGQVELSHWYRFNIVEPECNDFDNIQVSWVNSLGYRDYFDFQKRNDYAVSTNQSTYRRVNADWSAATFAINESSRGEKVYNKTIEETYVANTRYLTDEESTYLKNLYISPDVRVRFGTDDEWKPVILTDNQYTERTFRKDRLFQHTINFKLANPQQVQHG